mmetsp:Transcript_9165/g.21411  ORF Transcript_9165/g.21411 Transcript_9165/m.21411 type:complete len:324 (+) Transcript_9165:401-1372(+)
MRIDVLVTVHRVPSNQDVQVTVELVVDGIFQCQTAVAVLLEEPEAPGPFLQQGLARLGVLATQLLDLPNGVRLEGKVEFEDVGAQHVVALRRKRGYVWGRAVVGKDYKRLDAELTFQAMRKESHELAAHSVRKETEWGSFRDTSSRMRLEGRPHDPEGIGSPLLKRLVPRLIGSEAMRSRFVDGHLAPLRSCRCHLDPEHVIVSCTWETVKPDHGLPHRPLRKALLNVIRHCRIGRQANRPRHDWQLSPLVVSGLRKFFLGSGTQKGLEDRRIHRCRFPSLRIHPPSICLLVCFLQVLLGHVIHWCPSYLGRRWCHLFGELLH